VPKHATVTFSRNTAGSQGELIDGGILNTESSPIVLNSILWHNSGPAGGIEIFNDDASSMPTVSHSIIAGGYAGTGNLNVDPMLNTDLTLRAGSPAIDSGACGASVATTDILGNPRWDIASVPNAAGSNAVDMGAYEYQGTAGTDGIITNVACP